MKVYNNSYMLKQHRAALITQKFLRGYLVSNQKKTWREKVVAGLDGTIAQIMHKHQVELAVKLSYLYKKYKLKKEKKTIKKQIKQSTRTTTYYSATQSQLDKQAAAKKKIEEMK